MTDEDDNNIDSDLLLERYLNKSDKRKTLFMLFILAMGNASDAVEIMCVGFIMTQVD